MPSSDNFRLETTKLNELNEEEVLLKAWYISVDPYMRGRMNSSKSYVASFEVDQPIRGRIVARVLQSRSRSLNIGDIVVGTLPWATFCIEKSENLRKVVSGKVSPGYYLGILGMPGFTAYVGMLDICKPRSGETVLVSGAAGAVGIVAGQLAKIQGSRVIGIAGSDEKCKTLKEQFGFDEVLNYKTSKSLRKDIGKLCPEGINAYFDNVGGDVTDAVVPNLGFHARIALCGQISQYNNTRIPVVTSILPMLLTKSIMLQGFIISNYSHRFDEALTMLTRWINEGKLKYAETIIEGFEKLPEAFLGLFSGQNLGKMLIKTE